MSIIFLTTIVVGIIVMVAIMAVVLAITGGKNK
jgi:hypothetical protein